MSNKLKTALHFAAVASIATTISATSAHAGDKLPSAEIMAITYGIQAQQAVRRAEVMDMIETARSLNVSPLTVAVASKATTNAPAGDKLFSDKVMAITYDVQAQQAVRRAEVMDMVKTARSLNVSPLTVAQMEQGNLDITVSSGPSDD